MGRLHDRINSALSRGANKYSFGDLYFTDGGSVNILISAIPEYVGEFTGQRNTIYYCFDWMITSEIWDRIRPYLANSDNNRKFAIEDRSQTPAIVYRIKATMSYSPCTVYGGVTIHTIREKENARSI